MQSSNLAPLSIARHAIQFIWNSALQTEQLEPLGLLGYRTVSHITVATTHSLSQSEMLIQTSKLWKKDGIQLCGVFQYKQPYVEHMKIIEKTLQQYFSPCSNMPFIHLHITFDTKGCLESEAWVLQNDQAIKVPLLLTEDGQQQLKS